MSLTPDPASGPLPGEIPPLPREVPAAGVADSPSPSPVMRPRRRLWGFLFAIFTFEIGLFLAVFPWLDSWSLNHFSTYAPWLEEIWDDPYLKGAITGLGIVNLFIAFREMASLLRRR